MATKIKPSGLDSTKQFAFANTVAITAPVSANGTVGDAGQVLTSAGAGANAYWANTSSGGTDAATVITLSFLTAGM